MPFYLVQYSYTPEAWRALVAGTAERDRHRAIESLLRECGGRLPDLTFPGPRPGDDPIVVRDKFAAFGESDVVAVFYFPDNQRAAAFAMAVLAGGGVKSFKTTPLMTFDEAMRSMEMAGGASTGYVAPQAPPKS